MSRDLLRTAVNEVDTARDHVSEREASERLETLADRLRSQAERETTPALGVLDRIQNGLDEVASETDDETVAEKLESAREHILSFLETLDDRGMKQHGWSEQSESNGSA